MKHLPIIYSLFVLVFIVGITNAQETVLEPDRYTELEILDNNERLIENAQVKINDYRGVFDTLLKKYVVRYKDAENYHVEVFHPDYVSLDMNGLRRFNKKLYLLKKGEPCHFDSGMKYPVKDYSNLIYVTRRSGVTPEEDSVLQLQFEELISGIDMEVYFAMDSFVNRTEGPFHPAPNEVLKRSVILKSQTNELSYVDDVCTELKELRESKDMILCSGPLISNKADFSDARCPTGEASVLLREGVDAVAFEKKLIDLGMRDTKRTQNYGRLRLSFVVPEYSLNKLNILSEAFYSMPEVETFGLILNGHVENTSEYCML